MPGGDAAADAADDDWQGRVADAWRRRFLLPASGADAIEWTGPDPWAFADWPYLRITLERLKKCADAGAIGAAFDAIHATETHRRRFWKEAQKPIRPESHALFDIAAALPEAPPWALECIGRCIADGRNLKTHRMNIIHRLRAWAVAALADVRDANDGERKGTEYMRPLWQELVALGIPEAEARARAERNSARFTSELLEKDRDDRVREIFADTPLVPAPRQKERDGETAPDGEVLRASVRLVKRAFHEGRPGPFYLPSDRALRSLGMSDLAGWPAEIDRRIGRLFAQP